MTQQKLKFKSPSVHNNLAPEIDKLATKDLLKDYMAEVVSIIARYQEATKAWREKSVKIKEFDEGGLVPIWSPRMQSRGKLEHK